MMIQLVGEKRGRGREKGERDERKKNGIVLVCPYQNKASSSLPIFFFHFYLLYSSHILPFPIFASIILISKIMGFHLH